MRRALLIFCAGIAVAGCATTAAGPGLAAGKGGTANVAYAGSLTLLNEKVIGPAFAKATGHGYLGRGAGAVGLSNQIANGVIVPNVFESIGGAPIQSLEPKFTTWYIRFAANPLVIAYNPASPYYRQFQAIASGRKPLADLFRLMAQPGFRLGRTDPNLDPQGAAFILMLMLAQQQYRLPPGIVSQILQGTPASADSPTIFEETALEPRLQAGQVDAISAYLPQAVQFHLPYIKLPASIDLGDPALARHYATVSLPLAHGVVYKGQPLVVDITTIGKLDQAASASYVAYVLSPAGRAHFRQAGFTLLRPTVFGSKSAVPAEVRRELGG